MRPPQSSRRWLAGNSLGGSRRRNSTMHRSCPAVASAGCGGSARRHFGVVIADDGGAPGHLAGRLRSGCSGPAFGPSRGAATFVAAPAAAAPASMQGGSPITAFLRVVCREHAGPGQGIHGSSMKRSDCASSRDAYQVIAGPWCSHRQPAVTVISGSRSRDLREWSGTRASETTRRREVSAPLATGAGGLRQGAGSSQRSTPALSGL